MLKTHFEDSVIWEQERKRRVYMKRNGIPEIDDSIISAKKNTAVLPDDPEASLVVLDPDHFCLHGGANKVHCITCSKVSMRSNA